MAQQTSAYNFAPDFSDQAVERYPSLTRALGHSYPGFRTPAVADNPNHHHTSEYYSDHDGPQMSANGTPSSTSALAAVPDYAHHHASEYYSDHDAPISVIGMPSSMGESAMWAFGLSMPSEAYFVPVAYPWSNQWIQNHIMAHEATTSGSRNISTFREGPIPMYVFLANVKVNYMRSGQIRIPDISGNDFGYSATSPDATSLEGNSIPM